MQHARTKIPLASLLILASFAAFGAVLPAPAVPSIAHYFHISAGSAESVMVWYLMGYALGQLFYGPLANRFGRRTSLFIGAIVALLGSVLGMVAAQLGNFDLLVAARFITALGTAAGLVVSMILIKDTYDENSARGAFAKVVIAFAFVPFVAIAMAGSLNHHFGWFFVNDTMSIYALVVALLILTIPETLIKKDRAKLSFVELLKNYLKLFKELNYIKLVLIFAVGSATNYLFTSLAPVIAMHSMHVTSQTYGWLSIIPSLGIFLGASISTISAKNVQANTMILYGLGIVLLGSILLTLFFMLGVMNLTALFFTAFLMFCGSSIIVPNASMEALTKVSDHAHGASLMNAAVLILGGLSVNLTGHFIDLSVLALPLAVVIVGVLGLLLMIAKKSSPLLQYK